MDAIEAVRASLAASKRQGVPWPEAWRLAARELPIATDDEQMSERVVLSATREAWRRAYTDEAPTPGEVAAALLATALAPGEHDYAPPGALLLAA